MEDISVTVADDPIVVNIYTLAREWTVGNNITPTNLINFITYVMTSTQKFVTEKGNGQYKKRVVMTVLRKIVKNDIEFINESDKQVIESLVETLAPAAIDTVIGIATGKIDIGKQAQQVANVWKACFPCCFKK
jgi:hypothetical protein